MKRANVWWIVALLPHVGCAVLLKSDPFVPRYFSPESAATRTDPIAPSGLELRLGRVTAAAYLKERIVFRTSAYEVGYYEERRWTEMPESFIRRALSRALFDRRGIRQILYGAGTTWTWTLSRSRKCVYPRTSVVSNSGAWSLATEPSGSRARYGSNERLPMPRAMPPPRRSSKRFPRPSPTPSTFWRTARLPSFASKRRLDHRTPHRRRARRAA